MTTLSQIRTKVRRLTATPSTAQLPDSVIDDYINTFYQYDFPATAKVEQFVTNITIQLQAGVDVYTWDKNTNILFQNPVYVNGIQIQTFFDQQPFYGWYPQVDYQQQEAGADTSAYAFTLAATPIARSSLWISAETSAGVQLNVTDDGNGALIGDIGLGTNTVDYTTGAVEVDFSGVIPSGNTITMGFYPYNAGIPTGILFFDDTLKVRPIPDKPYQLTMQVQQQPTELLLSGSSPDLDEWWQFLAVGASKRILQDRLAIDQVLLLEPLYREQLQIVLSRTASQLAQTRVRTIYSDNFGFPWLGGFAP